jgi:hypothetical protein
MYGDQPFAAQWFEFVADAAHVFDRSVSSLSAALSTTARRARRPRAPVVRSRMSSIAEAGEVTMEA